MNPNLLTITHCVESIRTLIAENRNDRRAVLQIGYNLGRLSELTGLGREPFWDRWKQPVADWDLTKLHTLAQDLLDIFEAPYPLTEPGASPECLP